MGPRGVDTGQLLVTIFITVCVAAIFPTTFAADNTGSGSRLWGHDLHKVLNTVPAARWQPDPFSACSAPCGGGEQQRLIRCIQIWSRGQVIEVPSYLCPRPMPPVSQACNTHKCMGQWRRGPWSPCSVTCGMGTQKREVLCESSLLQGQRFQVSPMECGGRAPSHSRKCHVRDCPSTSRRRRETILSEDYTLVQLRKARKLKLNIGGKVKLLPGQTVVVKCPVRHYSRRLVYWSKGFKLVPFTGRRRVTSGGLRIQKADPLRDQGIYTCIAGDVTAKIKVEFTSKRDPSSKTYRTWARKSRRRFRRRYPNNRHGQERGKGRKDVIITSPYILDGRQRDQSTFVNRTEPLNFVSGDWSACSVTCGHGGQRRRKVTCAHVTNKYVKMVPEEKCTVQGLVKPATVEACGSDAECATWKTGPWSKCSPSCGKEGYKTRFLTCEWEKSGTPAWSVCDSAKRPLTRKPCQLTPCPQTCQDLSPYCHTASRLKMCRFSDFKEECCLSCKQLTDHRSRYNSSNNNHSPDNDNNTVR